MEELKKMQVEAGLIKEVELEKMDWMYSWGNKVQDNSEKEKEKYLLGQAIDERKDNSLPIVVKETIGNKLNEDFTKLHEDPLFEMR